MTNFHVKNFGQIKEANIELGDLTLFIGPQASGKTILLQLFKLVNDYSYIITTLKRFGFPFNREQEKFLSHYFGESMTGLWNKETIVRIDKKHFDLSKQIDPGDALKFYDLMKINKKCQHFTAHFRSY